MIFDRSRRLVLILFLLGGAASCVTESTSPNTSDLVVIERSKRSPPEWIKLQEGKMDASGTDLRTMVARAHLLDLPFGLKQTQLVGLEAGKNALADYLTSALKDAAKSPLAANAETVLKRQARSAVDDQDESAVKVGDLYFEKIEDRSVSPDDPAAHSYTAYALIVTPKDKLPQLWRRLAARLAQESDASLRRYSQVAATLDQH